MLSNEVSNKAYYSLINKVEDKDGEWWCSYTDAVTDDDDWDMTDAATLAIAYLVESGRLTYEDVAETTKALKRCADDKIGKACFIDRVMKDAARERGEAQQMKRTTIVLDNGDEIVTDIDYDSLAESLSMVSDFIRIVDIGRCRHYIFKAHVAQLIEN